MNRTLLIILILIQIVTCYITYRQEKYTRAIFAVTYFGVDKAEQLAMFSRLRGDMSVRNTTQEGLNMVLREIMSR